MIPFAKRDEVLKRRADFSGQLSTQCRTLSAGILAFAWALMTGNESPLKDAKTHAITHASTWNLVGISSLVILVLAADAVQYYAGFKVEERCLNKMGNGDQAAYSEDRVLLTQEIAFSAKLIGLGIAVVWLLTFLGWFWWGNLN